MNMPGMPKMDVDIALRGPVKHSGVLYPVSAAGRGVGRAGFRGAIGRCWSTRESVNGGRRWKWTICRGAIE